MRHNRPGQLKVPGHFMASVHIICLYNVIILYLATEIAHIKISTIYENIAHISNVVFTYILRYICMFKVNVKFIILLLLLWLLACLFNVL